MVETFYGTHTFGTLDGASKQETSIAPWIDLSAFVSDAVVVLHSLDDTWTATFVLEDESLRLQAIDQWTDPLLSGEKLQAPTRLLEVMSEDMMSQSSQSERFYTNQTGAAGDLNRIVAASSGGEAFWVSALDGGARLSVFGAGSNSTVSFISALNTVETGAIVDLTSLVVDGDRYLALARQDSTQIELISLSSEGGLASVGSIGPDDGLWVTDITTLVTTQVNGQSFILVGAAGSGSISVINIADDGKMQVVEHALDDRNAQFQNVQGLEVLEAENLSYVVAYGGDDGLSLFILLPSGQLFHKANWADQTDLGLDNINGISMSLDGSILHMFVTSETETGLTHLTYDTDRDYVILGSTERNTLVGKQTEDIILDGAGDDRMTGGGGADVFVLAADNDRDEILDFEVGVDLINLDNWEGLYNTDQITVVSLADGARVEFEGEQIDIRTSTRTPLTFNDFIDTDILGIARSAPLAPPHPAPVEIYGTAVSDVLYGNSLNNLMKGGMGNDTIFGLTGNDTLIGEDGRDHMNGGDGNDDLRGGTSHDHLLGGVGHDVLSGGTGADTLEGGGDNDSLFGDSSTDTLYGGGGDDLLTGGTGADILYGGQGDDSLLANTGIDTIFGGDGDDWISPGNGMDIVYGGGGNDHVIGRTGWDTLFGGSGDDSLFGSEGQDLLRGGDNNDFLSGGFGFDELFGEDGDDLIYGNIGEDTLDGGTGNDTLYGATGNDTLRGGSGDDVLYGAQGRDVLEGGTGNDFLRGGALGDAFFFDVGHDEDLVSNLDWLDRIYLSADLTGQIFDSAQVIATFGGMNGVDPILDFGNGDRIVFEDFQTNVELIDVIFVI